MRRFDHPHPHVTTAARGCFLRASYPALARTNVKPFHHRYGARQFGCSRSRCAGAASGSDTGDLVCELITGADGRLAPLLRPMNTVRVSPGEFKKLVRSGIVLRVEDDLDLKLGLDAAPRLSP